VTVGDDAQVKRPRMSQEKRAQLGAEAWLLKDREGMSYRTIADRFTARGDEISFMTVMRLIKEAQETAQFLDLVGPAEIRAGQLGRFDTYIEEIKAQIKTGILEPKHGWSLIVAVERLMMTVGGSAMPARMQVETSDGGPPPSMATIREFQRVIDEYEQQEGSPPPGYE
jgi:hypothetical protein